MCHSFVYFSSSNVMEEHMVSISWLIFLFAFFMHSTATQTLHPVRVPAPALLLGMWAILLSRYIPYKKIQHLIHTSIHFTLCECVCGIVKPKRIPCVYLLMLLCALIHHYRYYLGIFMCYNKSSYTMLNMKHWHTQAHTRNRREKYVLYNFVPSVFFLHTFQLNEFDCFECGNSEIETATTCAYLYSSILLVLSHVPTPAIHSANGNNMNEFECTEMNSPTLSKEHSGIEVMRIFEMSTIFRKKSRVL